MTHTTTSVMVWMGRKAAKALINFLGPCFTGARSVSAVGVPLSFRFWAEAGNGRAAICSWTRRPPPAPGAGRTAGSKKRSLPSGPRGVKQGLGYRPKHGFRSSDLWFLSCPKAEGGRPLPLGNAAFRGNTNHCALVTTTWALFT